MHENPWRALISTCRKMFLWMADRLTAATAAPVQHKGHARDGATTGPLQCRDRRWRDLSLVPNLFMSSFLFREGWKYYASFSLRTSFLRFRLARIACAYTSVRSIGFCVIWVCISSSSRSKVNDYNCITQKDTQPSETSPEGYIFMLLLICHSGVSLYFWEY